MGAKLKSKTHLQNRFFWFFEPFFAGMASKFEKRTNMTELNIILKKSKKVSKKAEFTLISNPLKKLFKNALKKSY